MPRLLLAVAVALAGVGRGGGASASSSASAQSPSPAVLSKCPDLLGAVHARTVGQQTIRGGTGENKNSAPTLELVALSTYPPVWSVANFLTAEECEYIIANADADMADSITYNDISHTTEGGPPLPFAEAYAMHISRLDPDASTTAPAAFSLADIHALFNGILDMPGLELKQARRLRKALDTNGDGDVDPSEWGPNVVGWKRVQKLANAFRIRSPERFTRYSKQSTIAELDPGIIRRIAVLVGLPPDEVLAKYGGGGSDAAFGEELQVVQYQPDGHYNCHHDSIELGGEVQMTRAYTVLFQLRTLTPAEGGQTWFPAATTDGERRTTPDLYALEERCIQNNSCADGDGLVVPSVQGTALVWLNHRSMAGDGTPWEPSGAFADLDRSSLHSGCGVATGAEKWIANQWVWQHSVEDLCSSASSAAASPGEDLAAETDDGMQQLWAQANAAARDLERTAVDPTPRDDL